MPKKNPHAVALGRLGGSVSSKAKTEAVRENAKKPRPNARKPRKKETQPRKVAKPYKVAAPDKRRGQ